MKYDEEALQDLQEGLRIDRDRLDEENISQPNGYFHASEGYAFAVSRRDKKKHDLEVTIAELDKEIRDSCAVNGDKITEAGVEKEIKREQKYHRAVQEHLNAALIANRWEALKEAYKQRSYVFGNLATLHASGYFGEVTGSGERRNARERFDRKRL
jgi:hypothetical protein